VGRDRSLIQRVRRARVVRRPRIPSGHGSAPHHRGEDRRAGRPGNALDVRPEGPPRTGCRPTAGLAPDVDIETARDRRHAFVPEAGRLAEEHVRGDSPCPRVDGAPLDRRSRCDSALARPVVSVYRIPGGRYAAGPAVGPLAQAWSARRVLINDRLVSHWPELGRVTVASDSLDGNRASAGPGGAETHKATKSKRPAGLGPAGRDVFAMNA